LKKLTFSLNFSHPEDLMKSFRQLSFAAVLTLVLSISALAGDISSPALTGDILTPGLTGDILTPGIAGDVGFPPTAGDVHIPGLVSLLLLSMGF
jgi:hypothetical protein